MTAENTSEESEQITVPFSRAKKGEWSPDEIVAQQEQVLERLDQLNADILSLLDEISARLSSTNNPIDNKAA